MILAGRVCVNGKTACIGDKAEPGVDVVTVDGRPIQDRPERVYIMVNKPAGYACTRFDRHLPDTVYDLLPDDLGALFTVGRLDVDTEGLLLMTNDGDWANGIAHPSTHMEKSYAALVRGDLTEGMLEALRWGVPLEEGVTQPARVRVVSSRPSEGLSRLSIIITEGRKRQVRRMLDYVGVEVLHLERTAIGTLALGRLPLGRWRYLEPGEVESLCVRAPAG